MLLSPGFMRKKRGVLNSASSCQKQKCAAVFQEAARKEARGEVSGGYKGGWGATPQPYVSK